MVEMRSLSLPLLENRQWQVSASFTVANGLTELYTWKLSPVGHMQHTLQLLYIFHVAMSVQCHGYARSQPFFLRISLRTSGRLTLPGKPDRIRLTAYILY